MADASLAVPLPYEPNRFRSTAAFYGRYRVAYPQALIARVAERCGLAAGDAVLDIGCGPGPLAIGFARLGARATGLDPEPEMLAAAAAEADRVGVDISLVEGSSYDLSSAFGRFRLAVMGRSFHWMDRPATLAILDRMIEADGAVVLFGDRRIAMPGPDWRAVHKQLLETHAPKQAALRRAHHGDEWLPHEAVLLASPFAALETLAVVIDQTLDIEAVVGRISSMSGSSPEALGPRRAAFEAELRAGLAAAAPDGRFREIVEVRAVVATRPAATALADRTGSAVRSEAAPG